MRRFLLLAPLVLLAAPGIWWLAGGFEPGPDPALLPGEGEAALRAAGAEGPALGSRRAGAKRRVSDDPEAHITGDVRGRVLTWGDERPIADATVWLLFAGGIHDDGETRQVRTRGDGSFRIPDVTPGTWVLLATHVDHVMRDLKSMAEDDVAARVALVDALRIHAPGQCDAEPRTIHMLPGTGLEGRVVDDLGAPVPGAEVVPLGTVWGGMERVGESVALPDGAAAARCDAEGRFRFPALQVDVVELCARTPRHAGRTDGPIGVPPPGPVELVVQRLVRLAGQVRYGDGTPAAGIRIYRPESACRMPGDRHIFTDEDGRFDDAGFSPGQIELDFDRTEPFVELSDGTVGEVAPGEEKLGLEFTVGIVRGVRGRLVDEEGQVLAEQELELYPAGGDPESGTIATTTTDEEGAFALLAQDLQGPCLLVHRRAGIGVVLARDLQPGPEPREYVSTLRNTPRVRLRVLDAQGEPVPRFRATGMGEPCFDGETDFSTEEVMDASVETLGRDGAATLELPGCSPWTLSIHWPQTVGGIPLEGYAPTVTLQTLPEKPVEIRLLPGGRLRVIVRDTHGAPVVGGDLTSTAGTIDRQGEGVFLIRDLSPLDHSLMVGFTAPPGYVNRSAEEVSPGMDHVIELRRARRVTGRITCDEPLSPEVLSAIVLQAHWNGQWGEVEHETVRVGADGRFVVQGVPEGVGVWFPSDSRLELPADLYMPGSVGVGEDEEEVEIPLRVGAHLRVRFTGEGADRLALDQVHVALQHARGEDSYAQDAEGADELVFRGIRRGRYDVFLCTRADGMLLDERRGVRTGSTVTFELPAVAALRGVVKDLPPTVRILWIRMAPSVSDGEHALQLDQWAERPEDAPGDHPFGVAQAVVGIEHDVVVQAMDADRRVVLAGRLGGLTPPTRPVLRLQPAEAIAGALATRTPDARSVWAVIGGVRIEGSLDREDGTFEIRGLPPGRYTVVALDEQAQVCARARGVATGTRDLALPAVTAEPSDD